MKARVSLLLLLVVSCACDRSGSAVDKPTADHLPQPAMASAGSQGAAERPSAALGEGGGESAKQPNAPAPKGDGVGAAAIPAAREVDVAALVGEPKATSLAAAPVRLPPKWSGHGVLARRNDRLPRRAPAWVKVEAEVVERDGQRYLLASGRAQKIKDVGLARNTAENRARSVLSAWTKSERQNGGAVREVWRDARSGDTFAQIELPVPAGWEPGTPLGGS